MTTSIFLKTYSGDFEWLPFLFRSIDKFVTGFDSMVIVCDNNGEVEKVKQMNLPKTVGPVHVVSCQKPSDFAGYVWQQYVKIKAFDYCHTDLIMFIDSDCVFRIPTNPNDFIVDGKPLLLKTHYSKVGPPWKPITEASVGFKVEWEYMRRLPLIYWRDSLIKAFLHRDDLYQYMKERAVSRDFSEFNYIGALVEKNEAERYHIHDTDYGVPEAHIEQNWSWGKVTNDVIIKLENILK